GRSRSRPTVPGRTARSSGSTAPCRPSGPTATSSPATSTVATPLHPGCTPTTLNAATAHSAASRPTAECHQPDGRVQLGAAAQPRAVDRVGASGPDAVGRDDRLLRGRDAVDHELQGRVERTLDDRQPDGSEVVVPRDRGEPADLP